MRLIIFLYVVLAFSAMPSAFCQDMPLSREERTEIAHEHIRALKGGVLIVRLPFYQPKVEALQDILSDPNSSNRFRIEKQLEETLADRREFHQNMIHAFRESYDFSSVYFMPDTATAAFKAGQMEGLFLNDNLDIGPSIRPQGPSPYFILRFGSTSDMTTDGVEAMVLMDDRFEDLRKPFPYYQRLNDFASIMGSLFPVEDQKKKDALRVVEKLNAKLNEYYERMRFMEDRL